jgi:hypothetical protein
MVKQNKMICLDEELIVKIRETHINASDLINKLLLDHFRMRELTKDPVAIERRIKELELKEKYEKELKSLHGN